MPSTTCSNAPSRQAGGSLACPQATNKPVKAVSHRNRRGRLVTDVKRSSTFCCNHPALKRAPPNGSRLSCGASACGRKHPALRYELVGAQTHASPESQPRQLQALVRRRHGLVGLLAVTTWAEHYESHPKNQEAGRDNEKSIDDRAR